MKNEFVQQKMVKWYRPRMLLSIALKAVISGTFGNYADRRELEAALDTIADNKEEWNNIKEEYCSKDEIWIDIISDTGDGFNSTFAIAKTVGHDELEIEYKENGDLKKVITKRGKILILAGDEVYPFPTNDEYKNRFKIPFASACINSDEFIVDDKTIRSKNDPHLYAIPGNHDWYDGLGNFIKIFCQQRSIGMWHTKQHRSYFALPLPNNYWVWATDIQLNSDIDAPQLKYFKEIAQNKMSSGDKVILVTAEPAWIYNTLRRDDRSFERLQFFIENYIHDKKGEIGKKFKLAATITGDLHHYSRYCEKDSPQGHQYITAGGGRAFLHLTHNLPEVLKGTNLNDNIKKEIFPKKEQSQKLLLGNFMFPLKNFVFTFLLSCIHLFFFWVIQTKEGKNPDFKSDVFWNLLLFRDYFNSSILFNPFIVIFLLMVWGGFFLFADINVSLHVRAKISAITHSSLQVMIILFGMYCTAWIIQYCLYQDYSVAIKLLFVTLSCFLSGFVAALFMGIYLYFGNRWCNMHIDEASSSRACPHYKNFLRLHIHSKGVTIYPIGIKKVPLKKWQQKRCDKQGELYFFTGNKIQTSLIENPIDILDNQL